MAFDDLDVQDDMNLDEPPEEKRGNRPFLVVVAVLVLLALGFMVCFAAYAVYWLPQQHATQTAQVKEIDAQNTLMAQSILQTSVAEAYTNTPTITSTAMPATFTPTSTPVVIIPTNTTGPTTDPRTATVAALFTQAAIAQKTYAPAAGTTSTALPSTGFADEVGLPGIMGLALLLLVVIFLARRLRASS